MSGNREKDWGKEKQFKEGQSIQRLDDLFFDYISLANKLKPKVVIAENVVGLIQGNARVYVHEICKELESIGYQVQLFRLNAASMGVPQTRNRIFFICHRNDLSFPKLNLCFNLKPILLHEIEKQVPTMAGKPLTPIYKNLWEKCLPGEALSSVHHKGSFFNSRKIWKNRVCSTITATEAGKIMHDETPSDLHNDAIKLCGSFPEDYDFLNVDPKYLIGMSVPPVMMAQLSNQIYKQWFCG
jgi:DNA (cytosine-5)-methyltransferase 1